MKKTGWPLGLLQDDSRELSSWFASRLDARFVVRHNFPRPKPMTHKTFQDFWKEEVSKKRVPTMPVADYQHWAQKGWDARGSGEDFKISHASCGEGIAVSQDVYWRYDKAPLGVDIFLLTEGGVAVRGQWKENAGFQAWHPLFKRDRSKETKP